jgi:4-amino-4-deoxy-L-arabinose transferase-like glycosyltransferase
MISRTPDRLVSALLGARAWHLPLLLAGCVAVYWLGLSEPGLRSSEGHRAIPGWTILHTGEWFPTRLFETAYLRKPPGMPWAVAVSSMILGENEFAARAVSALAVTLMVLAAFAFARRWFGDSKPHLAAAAGLAAGLSQLLLPRFWMTGRSAEIEALLCMTTQLAALLLIDLLVYGGKRGRASVVLGVVAAGGSLLASVLAKGPAGAPVIVGVIVATAVARRSWRPLVSVRLWGSIAMAAAGAGLLIWGLRMHLVNEPAETQSVTQFLWNAHALGGIALFGPRAVLHALPASLWLLLAWGRRVQDDRVSEHARRVARGLAWAYVVGLAIYVLAGASNPRHGLSLMVLLPPLAGYVAAACLAGTSDERRRLARRLCLGSPVALGLVLLVALAVKVAVIEPRSVARSTRPVGIAIGQMVDHDASMWSASVLNGKPELFYYARREAAAHGIALRPLWVPHRIAVSELPSSGTYMVLTREELAHYATNAGRHLVTLDEGQADGVGYVLVLVKP